MKPTGACVILTKEDKILGVTRKYNHSDWGLPGGKLDPGETALEAIVREAKEETGLDIVNLIDTNIQTPGYKLVYYILNEEIE